MIMRYDFTEVLISGIVCYHKTFSIAGKYILDSDYQKLEITKEELEKDLTIVRRTQLGQCKINDELNLKNLELTKELELCQKK